jgi:hypothetical protein
MAPNLQDNEFKTFVFLQISTRFEMGPKPVMPKTDALFISRLDELINMRHPLVRLSGMMNWSEIERSFSAHIVSSRGRLHCRHA